MPEIATPPRYLTLDINRTGDQALVLCHGFLVLGLTDTLVSNVRPLIPDCKRIILDLSDLKHMDSMGLGTLVWLYTTARTSGCELVLLNIGKRIRELLGLTNLMSVFTIIGEHGVKL